MKNCLKVYSLNGHYIFWEDGNKKIVAAVNCEGFGEVHSQVHPFLTAKSWKKRCLKSRRSTFLARMTESRGSGCSPFSGQKKDRDFEEKRLFARRLARTSASTRLERSNCRGLDLKRFRNPFSWKMQKNYLQEAGPPEGLSS